MATSPSPNSSPSADPPVSTTAPPPETLSPPPAPVTSTLSPPPAPVTSTLSPPPVPINSSSQHNASSPTATPTPPSQIPPTNLTASPPVPLSPLPPQPPISSPPPPPAPSSNPPESSPPPPSPNPSSSSPTPSPPSTSIPPPPLDLPARSPPLPLLPNPPPSPRRPPSPKTPASAPATPSEPSKNTPPSPKAPASPPATPSEPSKNTPPLPYQTTEKSPPPSPSFKPPKISPPPEESKPPQSPPLPEPPEISPPPSPTPIVTPPPDFPPSSTIRHKLTPPSPLKRLSPPPPSLVPPSSPYPPSPSQGPIPASGNVTTNAFGTPSNSNSTDNASIGTGGTVVIGLVLGLILLSLIGTAIWCVRKRKRKFTGLNGDHVILTSLSSSPKSDPALIKMQTSGAHNGSTGNDFVYSPIEHGGLGNSRSWFTYQELVNATNGFSMQNLIGEGGFGSVYKGYLFGGREVAVKQLKIGGGQGEREFKAEVDIISRVHHRHLVSLVGYCISENQRLLVYDYVPNNNLYFHLHGEGRPVMEWATRVKAAAGAARGISYLHEDCHPRIIHRDIKSSNILLDNSFEARVSDFGLAKLALEAKAHITTRVMGTFGYMAPEYASSGKLTEKSDVYSFGVVLLELITGRKPVDASQPLGDESLVEWARPLLNHALDNEDFKALADPRLENNYVGSEMFRIIEAAAACVRYSAAKRPRMGQVVRAFDGMAASDLTNGMRVGESEIFNSAQQSAEIRLFRRMTFGSQDYSTNSFRQNSWNS